ncbi:hypothetical protein PQX77_002871 [Marasmius sp. AFHP31]|nr:hypothetical protein PQX77_002871 [Marasmius sp. AFHP31]
MSVYPRTKPLPFLTANKDGLLAGPFTLKVPWLNGSPGEVTEEIEATSLGRRPPKIIKPGVNGTESGDQGILADYTSERASTSCLESEKSRQNEKQQDNSGSRKGEKAKDSDMAKPAIDKSWEVVMKEVDSLNNRHDKGWKDNLDAILVFVDGLVWLYLRSTRI